MEFNLGAIYYAESVAAGQHAELSSLLGAKVEFRSGISIEITLPGEVDAFTPLGDAAKFLPGLSNWSRVYRYSDDDGQHLRVLSSADDADGGVKFRVVEMLQPPSRGGPRPAVKFVSAQEMSHEECARWLIDVAEEWENDPERAKRRLVLTSPNLRKSKRVKIAWVGPSLVETRAMKNRLVAIGRVYGVELVHVLPFSFAHVRAQLKQEMPLAAVIVARRFAPQITDAVVPDDLGRDMALFCESEGRDGLEQQIAEWIELVAEKAVNTKEEAEGDERAILIVMLRGMISHSKIGQFNHCDRTTLLTGVRARQLSLAVAETILEKNSEQHQDSKDSEKYFLWKAHNDGNQYFVNSKKVHEIKLLIEGVE
jgi:hypothetical protein